MAGKAKTILYSEDRVKTHDKTIDFEVMIDNGPLAK